MIADPDTLLTAPYAGLTDRIIPARGLSRRGPGRPAEATDAELVCLAAAQVLLRFDDERHWLRAAPKLAGDLFPRLPGQSEYNDRLKAAAPLMEAALRRHPATVGRFLPRWFWLASGDGNGIEAARQATRERSLRTNVRVKCRPGDT